MITVQNYVDALLCRINNRGCIISHFLVLFSFLIEMYKIPGVIAHCFNCRMSNNLSEKFLCSKYKTRGLNTSK